jgi:hypothetical protein
MLSTHSLCSLGLGAAIMMGWIVPDCWEHPGEYLEGGVDAGRVRWKNVGSSQPRGTIIVLSMASDHAELVEVISSALTREGSGSRPNRRPMEIA